MTTTRTTRPIAATDRDLLRTATLTNMNWSGTPRFTYADIDRAPELFHYFALDLGRGDFGFVLEEQGRTLGVVWLLFLAPPDPGYGFVAEGVPELCVSVWSGYRGQGIGRALLVRALAEARTRGLTKVSLSVENDNPSLRLYRSVGFARAEGTPEGTYVAETSAPTDVVRRP